MITLKVLLRKFIFLLLLGMTQYSANRTAFAQQCYQLAQQFDITNENVSRFGHTLAVDGDRAIVAGTHAYEFMRINGVWERQSQLNYGASDLIFSVALENDTAILGSSARRCYVFNRQQGGTWTLYTTLFPINENEHRFGETVAMYQDWIAVGASALGGPDDPGGVHLFRYIDETWTAVQWIPNPDPVDEAGFGASLLFADDQLVVGAPQINTPLNSGGRVYVFEYDGAAWQLADTLLGSNQTYNDGLGSTLAFDDGTLLIGAKYDDQQAKGAGAVYEFQRDADRAWVQQNKITLPDGEQWDAIGDAIAIEDDYIAIGDRAAGNNAHFDSVHIFERVGKNWRHAARVWTPEQSLGGQFGDALTISDSGLFVGDWRLNVNGAERGALYFYELQFVDATDCNGDGVPDACQPDEDCNSNGIADICDIGNEFGDCYGNFVLDVCEIANGHPDCNSNSIPDRCEIETGISTDCNMNRIPDDCDIQNGILSDCNSNGIADVCEITDYTLPFSTLNPDYGWFTALPADCLWMNRFRVEKNREWVNSVSIYVLDNQEVYFPIHILVYRESDGDGLPNDPSLVSEREFTDYVANQWNRYAISPTYVGKEGDWYFVAVFLKRTQTPPFVNGYFYQAIDINEAPPYSSWWGIGKPGEVDIETLTGFSLLPLEQLGTATNVFAEGNWRIRADATHYEGVPIECMCPGNVSTQGDADGVDVFDLFELLANWGDCAQPCAPFCAGDISSGTSAGLPDCRVDMFDVMALLARWGECE